MVSRPVLLTLAPGPGVMPPILPTQQGKWPDRDVATYGEIARDHTAVGVLQC
jgi:hypothetical protein